MAEKLPFIQLYPGDWLRDPVSGCSLAAQALWLRMMFLMHDADRYGYLAMNGSPIPPEHVARRCGVTPEQYDALLAELDLVGVPSRTAEGIIYSRRMVRDDRKRQLCSAAGKKGGNPKMLEWTLLPGYVYAIRRESDGAVKIGASVDPKRRMTSGHGSLRWEAKEIIKTWPVTAMGEAEATVHEMFAPKCVGGEWFKLTEKDILDVETRLTLKGLLKGGVKPRSQRSEVRGQKAEPTAPPHPGGPGAPAEKPYRPTTPLQEVVSGFKLAMKVPLDDRGWDEAYFARYSAPAKGLLALFGQDVDRCLDCIEAVVKALEAKKLSWMPETLLKHASDWKYGRLLK